MVSKKGSKRSTQKRGKGTGKRSGKGNRTGKGMMKRAGKMSKKMMMMMKKMSKTVGKKMRRNALIILPGMKKMFGGMTKEDFRKYLTTGAKLAIFVYKSVLSSANSNKTIAIAITLACVDGFLNPESIPIYLFTTIKNAILGILCTLPSMASQAAGLGFGTTVGAALIPVNAFMSLTLVQKTMIIGAVYYVALNGGASTVGDFQRDVLGYLKINVGDPAYVAMNSVIAYIWDTLNNSITEINSPENIAMAEDFATRAYNLGYPIFALATRTGNFTVDILAAAFEYIDGLTTPDSPIKISTQSDSQGSGASNASDASVAVSEIGKIDDQNNLITISQNSIDKIGVAMGGGGSYSPEDDADAAAEIVDAAAAAGAGAAGGKRKAESERLTPAEINQVRLNEAISKIVLAGGPELVRIPDDGASEYNSSVISDEPSLSVGFPSPSPSPSQQENGEEVSAGGEEDSAGGEEDSAGGEEDSAGGEEDSAGGQEEPAGGHHEEEEEEEEDA